MKKYLVYILLVFSSLFLFIGITVQYKNANIDVMSLLTDVSSSSNSRIHFIKTGSSDAILIESNGKFGLVDSSNPYQDGTSQAVDNKKFSVEHVKDYLNSLGVTKLSFVIGTHSHSDHIGGMQVIANHFVDSNTTYYYRAYLTTLEDSSDWDNNGYYTRAINAMRSKGAQLVEVTSQTPTITLGQFTIQLLNTEPASDSEKKNGVISGENKNSIVEYITYNGKYKTLLAADMEMEDDVKIAEKIGKIDLLKIGHHGYASATSMKFAHTIKPNDIIVTNTMLYSHDTLGALSYLQTRNNTNIYVTGNTASEAIIVTYQSSGYSISPSDAKNSDISITEKTSGWEKVNDSYWLYYDNNVPVYSNWKQLNSYWYYFNIKGIMATGWAAVNGKWYYLNPSTTGNLPEGAMVTGWKEIDGKWYYLNPSSTNDLPEGAMVKGWKEIDGKKYYFSPSTTNDFPEGAMVTGWHQVNNDWYYMNSDGIMQTSWQQINNKWYYFNTNGVMVTGWNELTYNNKKNWYYFESKGAMIIGWKQLDQKWYYFMETTNNTYPSGAMVSGICMKIVDKTYCFESNGVWNESINSEAVIPSATSFCQSLTYNGSNQTITKSAGDGYTFSNNIFKNAGSYTVTAILKSNYYWSDNTRENKTINCTIGKANPTIDNINTPMTVLINNNAIINLLSNVAGTFKFSLNNSNVGLSSTSINVSPNVSNTANVHGISVGSSVITIKFTPSDTNNYNEITKTVTIHIVNSQDDTQEVVHALTIIPNGGIWNNKTDNSIFSLKKGDKINIPNPTREGFSFKKWTISNSFTSISGTELIMGNKDTTVTAEWERNSYIVAYHANGGIGSMSTTKAYYNTSFSLSANQFTKTNYKFMGWSLTADGKVLYRDLALVYNLTTENNKTITLYAIWAPNTYIVQYNSNGGTGSMSDSTITSNTVANLKKCTFTRDGYQFIGWSTKENGSVEYSDEDTISNVSNKDIITLYAVWLENSHITNTYTIVYNSNTGTGEMNNSIAYRNVDFSLKSNLFKKEGYIFAGWALTPNGTVVYSDNEVVNSISDSETVTLYAIWTQKAQMYSITYHSNGGTGEMSNTFVYENTDVQLKKNIFHREGYIFSGWSKDSNGKVLYSDEDVIVVDSSITLYAIWEKDSNDTILNNIPDTLMFSNKINLLLSLLFIVSSVLIIRKQKSN